MGHKNLGIDLINYFVVAGHSADTQQKDDFVRLVTEGGAVKERYVRSGIERHGAKMVFAHLEDVTVGVAALKVPLPSYRQEISSGAKSGFLLAESKYRFELGYVAVDPKYGGKGIGRALVNHVLDLSKGRGLFATTSHDAMKDNILPAAGFRWVGKSWMNARDEQLHLFILGD